MHNELKTIIEQAWENRALLQAPAVQQAVRQVVELVDKGELRTAEPVDPAKSEWKVNEWVKKAVALGAGEILLTSMDADGTKDGYDIELTRAVSDTVNVPVIASGGAGKLEHFYDVLTLGHADAVLAASVFHYGQFTVRQVKEYLQSRGVEVRF